MKSILFLGLTLLVLSSALQLKEHNFDHEGKSKGPAPAPTPAPPAGGAYPSTPSPADFLVVHSSVLSQATTRYSTDKTVIADTVFAQQQLTVLKYYAGKIDGDFGPVTDAAVKKFQTANNLPVTGIIDSVSWPRLSVRSLYLATPHLTGPDVKKLQIALFNLGYYNANIDGDFGPITDKAVRDYQTAKGLVVDGIAGPVTQGKLGTFQTVYPKKADASSFLAPHTSVLSIDTRYTATSQQIQDTVFAQQQLAALKYYNGTIDGDFGPLTRAGVIIFQLSNKLPGSGVIDSATWPKLSVRSLYLTTPQLTGPDVSKLQTALGTAPNTYYTLPATGTFDAATDTAVRAYQTAKGLVVDGIAGPVTQGALGTVGV